MEKVVEKNALLEMQSLVESVHIERDVEKYIAEIVGKTHDHPSVEVGSSPRGSLAILKPIEGKRVARTRDYVIPDDIKAVAISALNHRLILTADNWLKGRSPKASSRK